MHNTHTHVITVAHVKNDIHKKKSGKPDCIESILSDNFKEDTDSLYTLISLLFSLMLMHGVPPAGLLMSSLVPILKTREAASVILRIIDRLPSVVSWESYLIILYWKNNKIVYLLIYYNLFSKKSFHCCMYIIVKRNN